MAMVPTLTKHLAESQPSLEIRWSNLRYAVERSYVPLIGVAFEEAVEEWVKKKQERQ
jgi:hypothetical protein